ncbi:CPBP family intramembrane metalloprotease [Amycolatopsis azurea DSM 43854]|uniref:CPBP family intramembrane metalloprotease n=1 Tax=Amycolatopsis azurea DSM 43854 TaxID=1238180 RepID=A0ABX3J6Q8_9PSEU|nr:CPBP family intramembrane metalloprotease [Amycolatopsis azurea DSM 43854]
MVDDGQARERLVLGAHWGFVAFFAGIAGYHLVTLVMSFLLSGRFGGYDPLELRDVGPLLILAFLPTLVLGLGPAIGSRVWGQGLRTDFGLRPTWRDVRIGLACGAAALAAGYLLNLLLLAVYGTDGDDRTFSDVSPGPITELSGTAEGDTVWLVLAAVIVVLAAPVTEELLFRGSLWNAMGFHRLPSWVILLVTALVFAQLHGEAARTIALFGQGIAIGLARYLSGRVSAAVIAHAANNLPPAVLLFAAR